MLSSYQQSKSGQTATAAFPDSEEKCVYPPNEDDRTRLSYDSLQYSEVTDLGGRTTMSMESLRLNGHLSDLNNTSRRGSNNQRTNRYVPTNRNPTKDFWFQQPRIRACFLVSLLISATTIVVLTSGILESEWLENVAEFGLQGMRAQRVADASLIKHFKVPKDLRLEGKARHGKIKKSVTKDLAEGCETTIMLIRHCEKGDLRSHCNYQGFERAAYLASLFGDEPGYRWPAPSEVYALKAGGRGHKRHHYNYREIETVQFLADRLNLTVHQSHGTKQRKDLVNNLLEGVLNGEKCGKLTLISWKHSDLPKLAHNLGCGPFEGCPMDYKGKEFDQVWQIKYVYRSFHHGKKKKQTHKHWDIFGSVQYEHFDPLAFSKRSGDYSQHGTSHGGRWVQAPDQMFYD